jgi:hypothetical protein
MKTSKTEVRSKPSILLRAMYNGLTKVIEGKSNLVIEMEAYCRPVGEGLCGCAATAALQEAYEFQVDPKRWTTGDRADAAGLGYNEYGVLQCALDSARRGWGGDLLIVCGNHSHRPDLWEGFEGMDTENYIERMPQLLALVERLEAEGL